MGGAIEFVSNYSDISDDNGFQFEFHCDRCGSGYRTRYEAWATGTVSNILDGASSLFGGLFGQAADVSERVRSAQWSTARDDAMERAVTQIRPSFIQCPRCRQWSCRERCWNSKKGLCKECAPDMGVEMSAAQASHSVQEVWAHARMSAEDKQISEADWRQTIQASCPRCEAPQATNAKFCAECGERLSQQENCGECGTLMQPGARFCGECGAPRPQ